MSQGQRGNLCEVFGRNSDGKKKLVQEDIDTGTGEIAEQGVRGDFLQVPHEVDFLHAHDGDTGGGTDNQEAAARTGTVGEGNP